MARRSPSIVSGGESLRISCGIEAVYQLAVLDKEPNTVFHFQPTGVSITRDYQGGRSLLSPPNSAGGFRGYYIDEISLLRAAKVVVVLAVG